MPRTQPEQPSLFDERQPPPDPTPPPPSQPEPERKDVLGWFEDYVAGRIR